MNTTSQDWFNHIAQNLTSNALIQYVLRINDRIDFQTLLRSVLLSIQSEPVLGCLFVEKEKIPVWEPVSIKTDDVCCLVETQNIEAEINAVLGSEVDASKQLPVKVYLLDDAKSNVIVIKISHSACDGSGSKYFVKLLAGIYTRLEKDDSFGPPKNTQVRDTRNFYKACGIEDISSYFKPEKAELPSSWGFPVREDMLKKQTFSYRQLRYGNNDFQQLKQLAKKQSVTLNTLLMAAYFYALVKVLKPVESTKELQFMIDLRKYLPEGEEQNICNLSAIQNVELPTKTNDFTGLIKQTNAAIKNVLTTDNFIHGTIAGDLAEEAGYYAIKDFIKSDWENIRKTGNCTPMISNLGMLSAEIIRFGKAKIEDMYLVSPAFFAPAFMLGISTYNNVLTMSASYYSPGINSNVVEELLRQVQTTLDATWV
nr:condensation domain-containing protein [uncultured Draconibacterium sp.]